MRDVSLTTIKGGLNRLRTKGAALNDSLYDLLNGYVTTQKTVKVRPGTILAATLPAGTFGLVSYSGSRHVFASSDVAGIPAGYTLNVVRAPDGAALSKIHFAAPFLGSLYVAAEFVGGAVYHYWLADVNAWEASKSYNANDIVESTIGGSMKFRASRLGAPYPVWAENQPVIVGDIVEPATYNGLYFEVIAVTGDNPRTSLIQPDFDVAEGTFVYETIDLTSADAATTDPTPNERPADDVPQLVGGGGRYFLNRPLRIR